MYRYEYGPPSPRSLELEVNNQTNKGRVVAFARSVDTGLADYGIYARYCRVVLTLRPSGLSLSGNKPSWIELENILL